MAIWFPLRVGAFCTRKRSGVAMAILLVLVAALNSAWFEMGTDKMMSKPGRRNDYMCVVRQGKNQIKSNQIKSNQIKSNQIKSNQIISNQIISNQIKSNQIK
jgi:hypothetical protein